MRFYKLHQLLLLTCLFGGKEVKANALYVKRSCETCDVLRDSGKTWVKCHEMSSVMSHMVGIYDTIACRRFA